MRFGRAPFRAVLAATVVLLGLEFGMFAIPAACAGSFAQKIDGRVGGVVKGGSWTLTVPPGAFDGVATITLNETFGRYPVVDLGISDPRLNNFKVPVLLAFHNPAGHSAVGQQIFWLDPASQSWALVPGLVVDLKANVVQVPLGHFSTYSIQKREGKAGW